MVLPRRERWQRSRSALDHDRPELGAPGGAESWSLPLARRPPLRTRRAGATYALPAKRTVSLELIADSAASLRLAATATFRGYGRLREHVPWPLLCCGSPRIRGRG